MPRGDGAGRPCHTCASIGLNLAAGYAGKLDELLPESMRTFEGAQELPVPTSRAEVMKLCKIPIPDNASGPGVAYLKRVTDRWFRSTTFERGIRRFQHPLRKRVKSMEAVTDRAVRIINDSIEEVRVSVDKAHQEAASLTRLFELCRQAIEGQLAAHLDDRPWHGEKITARAARECFRLVAQSVGVLKLPNDQRRSATDATMTEMAKAIEATKDALQPIAAPPADPEKPN